MREPELQEQAFGKAAVIVAHPDDETIWAGGTILMHPQCEWTIAALTRRSDADRSTRFFKALEYLGAGGKIADLDDGPEQEPLVGSEIEREVLSRVGGEKFDLIITHSIYGEYRRHLRHEQVGEVVSGLWLNGAIKAGQMWMFAYEDGDRNYLPRAIKTADKVVELDEEIWRRKYDIITKCYGFEAGSFEARVTGRREAFWCFSSEQSFRQWRNKGGRRG